MLTLRQLHAWLPNSLLYGDPDTVISRIHTDTRSIQPGDLFLALTGDQFDGNTFVAEAIDKGAVAVIASQGCSEKSFQGLQVEDTKLALGRIAACWRAQFDLILIAITGSNGKTTVTQMVASILRKHAAEQALATIGNLNNDIGVPLTLLRLNAQHKFAVIELGMNHPGEIAYLAEIAKPSVVLVNNAQREHMEFMVSVEAVAHENGSSISSLAASGIAIFPEDDTYSAVWQALAHKHKTITFSDDIEAKQSDVCLSKADWSNGRWQVVASTPEGEIKYSLNIAGRHNVKNSLAAISCALAANIPLLDIEAGLNIFSPVKGRSFTQIIHVNLREVCLIDDTYNSNPDSMKAAIDALAEMPGPRLLVIGDMGEVGEQGLVFHKEAGEYAQNKGIEQLFAIGELSKAAVNQHKGARHFETIDELENAVAKEMCRVSSVLVKGSRFMKMERISKFIMSFDVSKNNNENIKEALHVT